MTNQQHPQSQQNTRHVQILTALGLAVIIALGAYLRFYQLGASGVGNAYYAAAVKSMLASWHNFFFVAYEPGGSVTLDKPPLGFWLEAVSACLFGINGFALALPNSLAGVLSIPLLFVLVKKPFGPPAGLFAALALAVTPITIAAERNNTIDGLLVFFLLLATWAVWGAVERGSLALLLLGAGLVGLAFNIKMLQAFMVLPALSILYYFGARIHFWRRIAHLGLAALLLSLVSLAWPLAVDAVPAAERPFIGSSTDNTVMELIVGHNGLKRLLGGPGGGPAGLPESGSGPSTAQGGPPPGPTGAPTPPGGPSETGQPGLLRLFEEPLASQASWLIPLALIGSGLALFYLRGPWWQSSPRHLALLLWAGWLIPVGGYFTFTSGLWHTYYLIMLGPPTAALAGAAFWAFDQLLQRPARPGPGTLGLLAGLSGLPLVFELWILTNYPAYALGTSIGMVVAWTAGLVLLWMKPRTWSLAFLLASLLGGPLLWSVLTTLNTTPNVNLPKAGPAEDGARMEPSISTLSPNQQIMLDFLLANTSPGTYLTATYDSHSASAFILATGRAVLPIGGFRGDDTVITTSQLENLARQGHLRFVIDNGMLAQKQELFSWIHANCKTSTVPGLNLTRGEGQPGAQDQFSAVYDCAK